MTGRQVYRHGVLALFCTLGACLFAIAAVWVWIGFTVLALPCGAMAGWHIGQALSSLWQRPRTGPPSPSILHSELNKDRSGKHGRETS